MNKYNEDFNIFSFCIKEVDEVFVDMRKGVAQTRYIGVINEGAEYWDEKQGRLLVVPENLVGLWMMKDYYDLRYLNFREAVNHESWVRCTKVETISYEYVEV